MLKTCENRLFEYSYLPICSVGQFPLGSGQLSSEVLFLSFGRLELLLERGQSAFVILLEEL